MGTLETAHVLSTLVDLLSTAPGGVVLGEKSLDPDPICEGLRRLIEGKTHLILQREVVPGNHDSVETFPVDSMTFDRNYAAACLLFRQDTAVPEAGMNYKEVIDRIGKWAPPISVPDSFSISTGEEGPEA